MKHPIVIILFLLLIPALSLAGDMEDDPVLASLIVDKREMRTADGSNPVEWDVEAWAGKDLNKIWLKTKGEYRKEKIEKAEFQGLYNRAIGPNWDVQVGVRKDTCQEPGKPDRNWALLGLRGLAPYFIDIDTALFLDGNGRTSLRFETEYEIMLTQQLALVPELEMDFFGKDDPATKTGSGLSKTELGLRLRYEIKQEFPTHRRQLEQAMGQNRRLRQKGGRGLRRRSIRHGDQILVLVKS